MILESALPGHTGPQGSATQRERRPSWLEANWVIQPMNPGTKARCKEGHEEIRVVNKSFGFPPQFPTGLGGFSPMHGSLSSSSAFPPGLGSRAHLSVFLLSSHWVRTFFIDRSLSVFLRSFLLRFGGFSSISEVRVFTHLPPQLTSTLTYYLLPHACQSSVLEGKQL